MDARWSPGPARVTRQHRGTARTRTVKIVLDGAPPEAGSPVLAGDKPLGTMGSSADGKGLALIRTDRAIDALKMGAARFGAGELRHEVRIPECAELHGVAERLNDMASRLRPTQDDLRRRNVELTTLAFRDSLTGVANRSMFCERLEAELSAATPSEDVAILFVDLDNFYCSGEVSGNGWPWSTSAREMDINVKTVPLSYAGRGSPRGINVDMPTVAERQASAADDTAPTSIADIPTRMPPHP